MKIRTIGLAAMAAVLLAGCATTPMRERIPHDPQRYTAIADPVTSDVLANVCHLHIFRNFLGRDAAPATGSAVLYQGRYLITAGHNVYENKSRISRIDVRCGVGDAEATPVQQSVQRWQVIDSNSYTPSFILFGMPYEWDYGVIRLNAPIETRTPFVLSQRDVGDGEPIMLGGYPGSSPAGKLDEGWRLYTADANSRNVTTHLFDYNLHTYASNSGGPVWQMVGNEPQLVGVHIQQGGARLVNDAFRDEIPQLIAELEERAQERGVD